MYEYEITMADGVTETLTADSWSESGGYHVFSFQDFRGIVAFYRSANIEKVEQKSAAAGESKIVQ